MVNTHYLDDSMETRFEYRESCLDVRSPKDRGCSSEERRVWGRTFLLQLENFRSRSQILESKNLTTQFTSGCGCNVRVGLVWRKSRVEKTIDFKMGVKFQKVSQDLKHRDLTFSEAFSDLMRMQDRSLCYFSLKCGCDWGDDQYPHPSIRYLVTFLGA